MWRVDSVAKNKNLGKAKQQKKDEFYTQLADIERELHHYRAYFKDKTVLCNCDDPYESNFFKYFAMNFNALGLKKLIATCYATSPVSYTQLNLFGENVDLPGEPSKKKSYRIEITEVIDANGDGAVDLSDVECLLKNEKNALTLLQGDGDFRSDECIEFLKEADVVVTNPPFSLFREYVIQLMDYDKKFIIIGPQNAISYKEIFPLILRNRIWLGYGFSNGNAYFMVPRGNKEDYADGVFDEVTGTVHFRNCTWFTNIDIEKRHEEMLSYCRYNPEDYPRYDNYDAIEVSKSANIPYDYDGIMGVPITFLDKYNPDQYEIVGITKTWFGGASKTYPVQIQMNKNGQSCIVTKLNDGPAIEVFETPIDKTYYIVDEKKYIQLYARILIRRKDKPQ